MKKGILYLVPTPIGNLKDITLRALEVLNSVDYIGSEDTRNSGKLLAHYQIKTPQLSYHKFNEKKRATEFISLLQEGRDIAIISDAGTPGISDPARIIVNLAVKNEIKIETLPGAVAFVPALVSSGMDIEHFYFAGFLPDKNKQKDYLLRKLSDLTETLVFYVSPRDIYEFAAEIIEYFGNRKICLARELSKLNEEYIHTTLAELCQDRKITQKGECVAVIEGKQITRPSDETIISRIKEMNAAGMNNQEIISLLAKELDLTANRIKKLLYSL